jgi:hypothetical protein
MKNIYITIFSLCFALLLSAQNGLDFDGTNDYVSATAGGPIGSTNRTVECWVKTSSSISTQQVIFDWGQMSPNGSRFTLNMINFGKVRIEVGGNGFNSTASIADGNWHHIAVTYDNSASLKFKVYIDGVLDGNQNTTVSVNTSSTGGFQIGRRNDGVNYFDGIIDEVRVWNVVRTQTEIQSAMNGEFCSTPPGLVAYYKFNHGTAGGTNTGITTLDDAVGSNDGTLSNFTLTGSSSNWVTGKSLSTGSTTPGNASITVCDGYTASNGTVWTTNGNYVDTISSATGCDSILNIALTVLQSTTGQLTANGCDSYTSPSGNYTWTTSGTYYDTLTNSIGCDSILTISLTITSIDNYVQQNGAYLTANMTGASYQWLDCNNNYAPISGATNRTYQATANGSYAVEISQNGCADTSDCYTVTGIGLEKNTLFDLQIHPNPARNFIVLTHKSLPEEGSYLIYDISGKLLTEGEISRNAAEQVIPIDMPAGVYSVRIAIGGASTVQKLIIY